MMVFHYKKNDGKKILIEKRKRSCSPEWILFAVYWTGQHSHAAICVGRWRSKQLPFFPFYTRLHIVVLHALKLRTKCIKHIYWQVILCVRARAASLSHRSGIITRINQPKRKYQLHEFSFTGIKKIRFFRFFVFFSLIHSKLKCKRFDFFFGRRCRISSTKRIFWVYEQKSSWCCPFIQKFTSYQ